MDYNEIFSNEYDRLNDAQREAVEAVYGPVMVVAGPGTGKTQIIGLRTANIIKQTAVNPNNILITTFTDAWVIAIRERLVRFLGNEAYKVQVSTIHSLSQDIIKTFPEEFLEYKAGAPVDEVDSLEILKEIIDEWRADKTIVELTTDYNPYFYLRDIKSQIGILKQEWVNFSKFEESIEKQVEEYALELAEIKPTLKKYATTEEKQAKHIAKLKELRVIYELYYNALRKRELYDFNDMIQFVLEKLQTNESLKAHYAEQFQFIMLDEYQDTNNAQNQIISLILSVCEDRPNIMVVGDDDQSIYRFQGANIENMLEFSVWFEGTQFIVLENNYRSNQAVLDMSQALIENNNERLSNKIETIDKKLFAANSSITLETPTLYRALSDIDEKRKIISDIKWYIDAWENLSEIAIIVRWNREVKDWTQLLLQNGIAAESKLKSNILESKYVNYICQYLELIADPYANEVYMIDLLMSDITWLSKTDVFRCNRELYVKNYTKKWKDTLYDFIGSSDFTDLELESENDLVVFKQQMLDFHAEFRSLGLSHFFQKFIEQTGILEYVTKNATFDDLQDVYTLFQKIKWFCMFNSSFSIPELLAKLDLHREYNQAINRQIIAEEKSGVQILTGHGSKGLEFNRVFIPGLYNGNWEGKRMIQRLKLPRFIAGDGLQSSSFEQIEEDRRLFFVALTRAKTSLHLSFPAGIGTKAYLPSSFIEEIAWTFTEVEISQEVQELTLNEVLENEIKQTPIIYTDTEVDYIIEFLKNYKISPSDLNTFIENPLEFLNRVVFKYPFIDNQYTIFWKLYHKVLEEFYLLAKSENKLPEKQFLLDKFNSLLSREVVTPEEKEKLSEKWKEGLEGYYDSIKDNYKEPVALEYSFRRKNIFYKDIPLTGTIDKIELVADEVIPKVNLIDYKTGKTKSLWEVKGLDRYGNKKEGGEYGKYYRQLLFYKLMCEQDQEFVNNYEIASLALDFVEGRDDKYKLLSVDYSQEDYEIFKEELESAWKQIKDVNFWRELLVR